MTFAPTFVEKRLNQLPPLPIVFNLCKMLPLGTEGNRETVREVKGDELRQLWFVAMRQITTLMPATKTLPGIFGFWWRRPPSPALNQIAHARDYAAGLDDAVLGGWLTAKIESKSGHIRKPPERGSATRSSFANQEAVVLNGSVLRSSAVAAGQR